MNGKDVINAILKREGISASDLANDIGMKRPQGLYDILNGKTKNVSKTMAMRIKTAKPAYSEDWLLTGEGPMLDTENTESGSPLPNNVDCAINALLRRIDRLLDIHERDIVIHERNSKNMENLLTLLLERSGISEAKEKNVG